MHLEVEGEGVVAGIVSVELGELGEVSGGGRAGRRVEDAEELEFGEFLGVAGEKKAAPEGGQVKGEGAPPRADVCDSERRQLAVGQRWCGQARKKYVLQDLLWASRDGSIHAVFHEACRTPATPARVPCSVFRISSRQLITAPVIPVSWQMSLIYGRACPKNR